MKPSYQDALAYYGIGGAHPGGLDLTIKILSRERIHKRTKILDAGCGTGQTSAFLAETYHCDVTAVELNPLMVQRARQRFSKEKLNVELVRGSVENLPFQDHTFDLIVVESVTIFTNIKQALKEFYRVLKPNGVLIDLEMTTEPSLTEKDVTYIKQVYGINRLMTERNWLSALQQAGFRSPQIIHSKTILKEVTDSHSSKTPNEMSPFGSSHPVYQQIIMEHMQLIHHYADKLGHRVFRAVKKG